MTYFEILLDLLDLSHHSRNNEVLFVNIGARVLDLWLDMSSGPKWCQDLVSRPQVTRSKTFFEIL